MSLGENIKAFRNQKGLTQSQLAELSDVRFGHISKIERNTADPKISTFMKIVGALGCSSDDLLFEKNKSTTSQKIRYYTKSINELSKHDQNEVLSVIQKYLLANEVRKMQQDSTMNRLLNPIRKMDDMEEIFQIDAIIEKDSMEDPY